MSNTETWFDLARNARKAANHLIREENFRSCIARAYYAAYSRVAHELVATAGLTMPRNREGPNHPGEFGTGGIRKMIESSMPDPLQASGQMAQTRREKLSELIGRLYALRIAADYQPSMQVGQVDARAAISILNTIFDWL